MSVHILIMAQNSLGNCNRLTLLTLKLEHSGKTSHHKSCYYQDYWVTVLFQEIFLITLHSQCWEMVTNAHILLWLLQYSQHYKGYIGVSRGIIGCEWGDKRCIARIYRQYKHAWCLVCAHTTHNAHTMLISTIRPLPFSLVAISQHISYRLHPFEMSLSLMK